MAITIIDVAKRAGVSHTTVSWALHDDPRITNETKMKVMKAVQELNYIPNLSARGLVTGKSNSIAIVTSFFSSIFEMQVLRGFEEEMDNTCTDFNINFYTTRAKAGKKNIIFKSLLGRGRTDAVIALNIKPSPQFILEYRKTGIPLILIEEKSHQAICIKINNHLVSQLAVKHLLATGKKNIALVIGKTTGIETGLSPRERLAGFRDTLQEEGLSFNPSMMVEVDNYCIEEGEEALRTILKNISSVDAIYCAAGDTVAMGIIREARRLHISIPKDIALIGVDDIEAASLITPALTTIRQPLHLIGAQALRFAAAAIRGEKLSPTIIEFKPQLIVRESA